MPLPKIHQRVPSLGSGLQQSPRGIVRLSTGTSLLQNTPQTVNMHKTQFLQSKRQLKIMPSPGTLQKSAALSPSNQATFAAQNFSTSVIMNSSAFMSKMFLEDYDS